MTKKNNIIFNEVVVNKTLICATSKTHVFVDIRTSHQWWGIDILYYKNITKVDKSRQKKLCNKDLRVICTEKK